MRDPQRWIFKGLLVLWTLTSVKGVEIDGKLGKPEADSSKETHTQLPYAADVASGSPCPPEAPCLLLNLVLGPSSVVSLVPLVPILKGKSVVTASTIVPVIKGKPVVPLVPLVPVIKGKSVEPPVPTVPVIKGKPVTHSTPVTRKPSPHGSSGRCWKIKPTTLCCHQTRRFYDYLGRPCRPSYFPIGTSKPTRRPTSTNQIYPTRIYPATHSGGVYPAASYPATGYAGRYPPSSFPATHRSPWRERQQPRPLKGGGQGVPWTPMLPYRPPVVKVDGRLGLPGEGDGGTVAPRVAVKVDGKLGSFEWRKLFR